jgi:hypothetical protein
MELLIVDQVDETLICTLHSGKPGLCAKPRRFAFACSNYTTEWV